MMINICFLTKAGQRYGFPLGLARENAFFFEKRDGKHDMGGMSRVLFPRSPGRAQVGRAAFPCG